MAGLEANNIPRADTASTFIGSLLYRYIYFWGMYVVVSNSHKLKQAFNFPKSELPGNAAAQPACHLASVFLGCAAHLAREVLITSKSAEVPEKWQRSASLKKLLNVFQYSHGPCAPFECMHGHRDEPKKYTGIPRV